MKVTVGFFLQIWDNKGMQNPSRNGLGKSENQGFASLPAGCAVGQADTYSKESRRKQVLARIPPIPGQILLQVPRSFCSRSTISWIPPPEVPRPPLVFLSTICRRFLVDHIHCGSEARSPKPQSSLTTPVFSFRHSSVRKPCPPTFC